jgi:hypothetical protein
LAEDGENEFNTRQLVEKTLMNSFDYIGWV